MLCVTMVSETVKGYLKFGIFMFRMTRAKSLIAGPHTYTYLLLRNLVVNRPTQRWALFAYAIGVCLMEAAHRLLLRYRKRVMGMQAKKRSGVSSQDVSGMVVRASGDRSLLQPLLPGGDSGGQRSGVKVSPQLALVGDKTREKQIASGVVSQPIALESTGNTMSHEYASAVTNTAYLCIFTIQLLHVTAMSQTFMMAFVLLTIRLQQTLSGGKRTALFSGPVLMLAVTALCGLALISRETEFDLPTPGSPYANEENGPSATAVIGLCIAVGASAHAHLQWVVLHEHNDAIYLWNKEVVLFTTFASHLVLASLSAFIAAFHPIMIDINMVMNNPRVGMLLPRLTLTVLVLLLCTAPICDSCVFHTLFSDGSVIVGTVIIVQAHPAMGSFVLIAISVSVSILAFFFVFVRCDEWPWRRWSSRLWGSRVRG